MNPQLIAKLARRKLQPTAAQMREQLAMSAEAQIEERIKADVAREEAERLREACRQADIESAGILAVLLLIGVVLWAADRLGWLPSGGPFA